MYTLEERIEQDEVSEESLGTKKKKKKKIKIKANLPVENEPPCKSLDVKVAGKDSFMLTPSNEVVNSPTRASRCEEMDSMDVNGSGDHESPDAQSIFYSQSGKEGMAVCKKEESVGLVGTTCKDSALVVCHTVEDHSVSDLSMDIPEDESLVPSAKALSTALQAATFPVSYTGDDSFLKTNENDSRGKYSPEQFEGNVDAKGSIGATLERDASNFGATKPESVNVECVNDHIDEDISECNISSVAANVEIVDEEETRETQGYDIAEETTIDNEGVLSYKDGDNSDKTCWNLRDLNFSSPKISEPDFVVSVDTLEREFSLSVGSTHLLVTGEEKTFRDALNVERCSKTTGLSMNMNDNSGVAVDDIRPLNQDNDLRLEEEHGQGRNNWEQNDHYGSNIDDSAPLDGGIELRLWEEQSQERNDGEQNDHSGSNIDDCVPLDESNVIRLKEEHGQERNDWEQDGYSGSNIIDSVPLDEGNVIRLKEEHDQERNEWEQNDHSGSNIGDSVPLDAGIDVRRKEEQTQLRNDGDQNDHSGSNNSYPLIHFECLKFEGGENIEQTSKDCGENNDSSASSSGKTTVQGSSLFDSKPVVPKADEIVGAKCDLGEEEESENGRTRHVRVKSECTKNVLITRTVTQAKTVNSETHLQHETKEEGWGVSLEHGTARNERAAVEQITSHAGIVPQLVLNATEPLKGDNENIAHLISRCGNIQRLETAHSSFDALIANDEAMEQKFVEMPASEHFHYSRGNEGLSDEEKGLFELQETTQHFTPSEDRQLSESCLKMEVYPVDSSGDANRTIDPTSNPDMATDSSSFPLFCAKEDRPFCSDEEVKINDSSVPLDGTAKSDAQGRLSETVTNGVNKGADVSQDALKLSTVVTPQASTTATNNFDILAGEEKLSDFAVASTPANVPNESVKGSESQSRENGTVSIDIQCSGLVSSSGKVHSKGEEVCVSGHSFSSCQGERECQHICHKESEELNVEHNANVNEPSRNVTELPADHLLRTSNTVQGERQFGEVEVTSEFSDPKDNGGSEKPDGRHTAHELKQSSDSLLCEDSTKGFDTLGDKTDTIASSDNKSEPLISNLVNLPEKDNDVTNELGTSDSILKGKNSDLAELTVDSVIKTEDKNMPFNKGAEIACVSIKREEETKEEKADPLRNTVDKSRECVGEGDKEEGEINSEEEQDNTPEVEKPKKEEKEEGELSSSDSDAEALAETWYAKQGDAASFSKVVEDKDVLKRREKEIFPTRRHSSSEVHHTLSKERSQLTESSSNKRRSSSSSLRNTDLRTKLREFRKKRISLTSQTVGETKIDRLGSGSRSVEKAMKKNEPAEKRSDKPSVRKGHSQGKDVRGGTKDKHAAQPKNIKQQTTSQVERRRTLKHPRESGSSKNGEHGSSQSVHGKAGRSLLSVSSTTVKTNDFSQGDEKVKKKSPRSLEIKNRPGKRQCDVKKSMKKATPICETGGNKLPKSSHTAVLHETKMEGNESKTKLNTAGVQTKDNRRSETEKMTRNSPAASRLEAKTSIRSKTNLNTSAVQKEENRKSETKQTTNVSLPAPRLEAKKSIPSNSKTGDSSPAIKKISLQNKTTGKVTPRSREKTKLVNKSSTDTFLKPHSASDTSKKKGKVLSNLPTSGKKTDNGIKHSSSTLLSPQGKAQSKPQKLSNVKDGTKPVSASTFSKDEHSDKSRPKRAKTAVKASPRMATKKVLKKSPANVASKAKTRPQRGNEARPGNPRKRSRSEDSTEARQGKRLRLKEGSDSASKLPTGSSATKVPKIPVRTNEGKSNRENQPPSSTLKVPENKMVPVRDEKLESTDEHMCMQDDSKKQSSEIDSVQAKPILIGRNKCLVFKRRHVNQLFVRGDNVVMVAYAK